MQDQYTALMKAELERFTARDAGFLFHDDLAEVNDPVYFHEFIAHAGRHRLQFLCEAELVAMAYGGLTPEAKRVLDALDPLAREQYLDFAKCRRFRQTLLCHEEVAIERRLGPEKVPAFRLSARRRVQIGDPSAAAAAAGRRSRCPRPCSTRSTTPRRALLTLAELGARVPGSDADYLRRLTWAAACAGAIQLHVHVPRPGDDARASGRSRARWPTPSSSTARPSPTCATTR